MHSTPGCFCFSHDNYSKSSYILNLEGQFIGWPLWNIPKFVTCSNVSVWESIAGICKHSRNSAKCCQATCLFECQGFLPGITCRILLPTVIQILPQLSQNCSVTSSLLNALCLITFALLLFSFEYFHLNSFPLKFYLNSPHLE